ncbi:hypothetical protein PIROE2DRAFT_10787 [Piromyces sp. E2]|nr:hypothetical protein PIROE2DRAFT_10787 [Piromyces sp. E2]|eukprot:OUM62812.1 hypothetical protein PIROE2DRAFT_10787 [Piromyces sp. E2]
MLLYNVTISVEFNPCPKCHQKLPLEIENMVKDIIKNFTFDNKIIKIIIPSNIVLYTFNRKPVRMVRKSVK